MNRGTPPKQQKQTVPNRRHTVADADRAARQAMEHIHHTPLSSGFSRLSNAVARATGRPITFVLSCVVVIGWALTGPIFGYSDTWQLVINTGTTIVTFLMVFLIQNTQNRDGAALQAKLDELIRATQDARDAYMGIENLPDEEVEQMRANCTPAERQERARVKRSLKTVAVP